MVYDQQHIFGRLKTRSGTRYLCNLCNVQASLYVSGTSAKTRNIATRADTLGVSSRWESEEGYSTHTPGSRVRTAMTSSTLSDEDQLSNVAPAQWILNGNFFVQIFALNHVMPTACSKNATPSRQVINLRLLVT